MVLISSSTNSEAYTPTLQFRRTRMRSSCVCGVLVTSEQGVSARTRGVVGGVNTPRPVIRPFPLCSALVALDQIDQHPPTHLEALGAEAPQLPALTRIGQGDGRGGVDGPKGEQPQPRLVRLRLLPVVNGMGW